MFHMKHGNNDQKFAIRPMGMVLLMMAVGLSACSTHQVNTHPKHWAVLMDKSANFYQVDDKLYRSEQPIIDDKPLILDNNIKTVINLRYFDRDDDQQVFRDGSVVLLNEPLLAWRISPKDLARVLYAIRYAQQDGAVLVHCYHGADRTGIVVAMYRIIYQHWSIDEARKEMQNGHFGYHAIWKNIDRLLTDVKVWQVRAELAKLEQADNR